MLSRFIAKPSNLRFLALISSQFHPQNPKPISPGFLNSNIDLYFFPKTPHFYSTNNNNNNNGKDSSTSTSNVWKLSSETDQSIDSVFSEESGTLEGFYDSDKVNSQERSVPASSWLDESLDSGFGGDDIFKRVQEKGSGGGSIDEWATAEGYKPWSFAVEEKEGGEHLFDIGEGGGDEGVSALQGLGGDREENLSSEKKSEEQKQLQKEEEVLTAILKGPNRAFGDLVAASGITESMLDSLIALKDLEEIQGLPPLREIEDMRYEKSTRKSTRADIERQKQEEVAKARIRQVDDKGRAYGTGRRKCSIARVWIQPGDGKFVVNDKEFDVYFPVLDHRASLLRPLSETKTLGMWNVTCTVKGGGVSGQVGAIQLGLSKALQNWAPDMRPPLREAGFLTRDSRVVERKKPGKAKARKSFQWVKR